MGHPGGVATGCEGARAGDAPPSPLFPGQSEVVPLRFSRDLDAHNPNTPEWREDVGLAVSRLLSKVPGSAVAEPPPLWAVGAPGEVGGGGWSPQGRGWGWEWAGCPVS